MTARLRYLEPDAVGGESVRSYRFRIVNVFAQERLGGNPLCVFEDGRGLDAPTMQRLALQFNLSETVFLLPSDRAQVRVRIFTPEFEMPFAGHPTLGSAHVAREMGLGGDSLTLETQAALVPVVAQDDTWTLTARSPVSYPLSVSKDDLATMLGLAATDLEGEPLWVDTGSEQLIVPLATANAVRRCRPVGDALARTVRTSQGPYKVYVWSWQGPDTIVARFFFPKGGAVVEDPGTGSACANLGGWLSVNGYRGRRLAIEQGECTGRPCRLGLTVDEDGTIRVSGRVLTLGQGVIDL